MPLQQYNEQWTYTEMANIEMKKHKPFYEISDIVGNFTNQTIFLK